MAAVEALCGDLLRGDDLRIERRPLAAGLPHGLVIQLFVGVADEADRARPGHQHRLHVAEGAVLQGVFAVLADLVLQHLVHALEAALDLEGRELGGAERIRHGGGDGDSGRRCCSRDDELRNQWQFLHERVLPWFRLLHPSLFSLLGETINLTYN